MITVLHRIFLFALFQKKRLECDEILVNQDWFEEKRPVRLCIYVPYPSLEVYMEIMLCILQHEFYWKYEIFVNILTKI